MATVERTRRRRLSQSERAEQQRESLSRAVSGISAANYAAIILGFEARGIPTAEILPRENVFTFNAWKALGRYVRKGEKGVAVVTWIPTKRRERDASTGEICERESSYPKTAYVFHISQTEPVDAGKAVAK